MAAVRRGSGQPGDGSCDRQTDRQTDTDRQLEPVCFVGDQWLQFDVGPASLVTGVVTRGRADTSKRQWVTRYKLAYSNDTRHWVYYNDASHLDSKVCVLRTWSYLPGVTCPAYLEWPLSK